MDTPKSRIDALLATVPIPPDLPDSTQILILQLKTKAKKQLLEVFVKEKEAMLQVMMWEHLTRASFTREEKTMTVQEFFAREELRLD